MAFYKSIEQLINIFIFIICKSINKSEIWLKEVINKIQIHILIYLQKIKISLTEFKKFYFKSIMSEPHNSQDNHANEEKSNQENQSLRNQELFTQNVQADQIPTLEQSENRSQQKPKPEQSIEPSESHNQVQKETHLQPKLESQQQSNQETSYDTNLKNEYNNRQIPHQNQSNQQRQLMTESPSLTNSNKSAIAQEKGTQEIEMIEQEENPSFPDDQSQLSQRKRSKSQKSEENAEIQQKPTENPIVCAQINQKNQNLANKANNHDEEQKISEMQQPIVQNDFKSSQQHSKLIEQEEQHRHAESDTTDQKQTKTELAKREEEDEFGDFEQETQKISEIVSTVQNTESQQQNPSKKPTINPEALFSLKQDDPIIKLLNLTQETVNFLNELPSYKEICDVAFA